MNQETSNGEREYGETVRSKATRMEGHAVRGRDAKFPNAALILLFLAGAAAAIYPETNKGNHVPPMQGRSLVPIIAGKKNS